MAALFGLARRNWQLVNPPEVPKSSKPLRFGILGAADIGPQAIIVPAKTHPDVVVQAVAARDPKKAEAYAGKHGIPEVAGTYQDILDDPDIDCVYIPLPNGLHFEWALKALRAGKHVLLEKPSVDNAEEAELLFQQNSPLLKNPSSASTPSTPLPPPTVLLEAAHYLFHPAWTAFMQLVTPSAVTHAHACLWVPRWKFADDDIRYRYELGGGALMDLGAYTASALSRVFGSVLPVECRECETQASAHDARCDRLFRATYAFPGGGVGDMEADLKAPLDRLSPDVHVTHRAVVISEPSELEEAGVDAGDVSEGHEVVRVRKIKFATFVQPAYVHSIQVDDEFAIRKIGTTTTTTTTTLEGTGALKRWKKSKTIKAYTFREVGIEQPGEPYWATYRYQLEQLVNKVRGRATSQWVDGVDSIRTMRMIDMAYEAAKLPLRQTSEYR